MESKVSDSEVDKRWTRGQERVRLVKENHGGQRSERAAQEEPVVEEEGAGIGG